MMKTLSFGFEIEDLRGLRQAKSRLNELDVHSTVLPEEQEDYRNLLKPLLGLPRMSTFANGSIIARTVREMAPDTAYVNVGVWHGFSFFAGMLAGPDRKVVGVDNFSQFGGPRTETMGRFERLKGKNHALHDMDYRDYFSNVHEGEIGFYFYDGEHSYENQLQGLQVAEPFFSRECIIMVDDTNWKQPRKATMDFMSQSSNRYRILLDRQTAWNGHPTFWNGIMLLQREA